MDSTLILSQSQSGSDAYHGGDSTNQLWGRSPDGLYSSPSSRTAPAPAPPETPVASRARYKHKPQSPGLMYTCYVVLCCQLSGVTGRYKTRGARRMEKNMDPHSQTNQEETKQKKRRVLEELDCLCESRKIHFLFNSINLFLLARLCITRLRACPYPLSDSHSK